MCFCSWGLPQIHQVFPKPAPVSIIFVWTNRVPAVALCISALFIASVLTHSVALSNYLKLSFLPALPFPHWLASSLSAAVSVEQKFKHCSLQQHMSCCSLEASRNLMVISSSLNTEGLSLCLSQVSHHRFPKDVFLPPVNSPPCHQCCPQTVLN